MKSKTQIYESVQKLLRCPVCHAKLIRAGEQYDCTNSECATHFPILDGIPVLINEQSSVFSIDEIISNHNTELSENVSKSKLRKTMRSFIPANGINIKGKLNYIQVSRELLRQSPAPQVLVIGGRIVGNGMEAIANNAAIDLIESDVSFGPRTMFISDAHDIPFEDRSFDGVIVQAVLDDVVDPYRCSEEIHRVLKEQGVVYAETPFMQQVHSGPYDFTRFTHLGLRRLFRRFEEIDSGAVGGPGMALAWSYEHFLLSFTTSSILRDIIRAFARLTSFYLKYFDYYLIDKPGTLDAASGHYFIGRKTDRVLSDQDLIKLYRGAQ